MTYYKTILLTSIFYLTTYLSLFSQLYPVKAMTVDASFLNEKFKEVKVKPFRISNLITVEEFKEYLDDIRRDSSEMFYLSQLPSSGSISEEFVESLLSSESLQNEPMPGVSWVVARNYCAWLNTKSNSGKHKFDLPYVSELMAFNELYGENINSELMTWTLNSYDESLIELSNSTSFDYSYNAYHSDPPSMKRKVIFGQSYHMNYDNSSSFRYFQYEYQDSSSRYVGFRVVKRFKENIVKSVKTDEAIISCRLIDNQLDGLYQEKYLNGKLKVLGTFSNNQRVGVWSVWDEEGVLEIQRDYKNNKQCEFLFPIVNNPYKELHANNPEYVLKRNSNDFYDYQYVEERTVVYSQRVWRQLTEKNESHLFQNVDFNSVVDALFKNNAKWYHYGDYGNFKSEILQDSLAYLQKNSNFWDFSRIEVKEDFFFNIDNLLSNTRQLGISFFKEKGDKKPSYTVYYPLNRVVFADFKIADFKMDKVENLDDIFFFHAYRGKITKIDDVYQSEIDNLEQLELKVEFEKLAFEHDLWLSYGR